MKRVFGAVMSCGIGMTATIVLYILAHAASEIRAGVDWFPPVLQVMWLSGIFASIWYPLTAMGLCLTVKHQRIALLFTSLSSLFGFVYLEARMWPKAISVTRLTIEFPGLVAGYAFLVTMATLIALMTWRRMVRSSGHS